MSDSSVAAGVKTTVAMLLIISTGIELCVNRIDRSRHLGAESRWFREPGEAIRPKHWRSQWHPRNTYLRPE